ncbi:MAG: hypothetical protein JSV24_06035 [Bacteroidales bacterium]|nr:MAG: hypothetical protein JSV24_06035 [Bacteroidales bacterium]
MLPKGKGILLLIAYLVPTLIFGQAATNSPYSRYGVGNPESGGLTRNSGMGGISLGMRDPGYIDFQNPASLSARDSLSFIFDFGMVGEQFQLTTRNSDSRSRDINFKHIAIAFPVTKWLGAGTGIVPFSSISYDIIKEVREGDPDYIPETGGIDYLYRGNGGVHRFFLGTGIDVYKGLSVGLSLSYLFGTMERARSITFVDEENFFNTKVSEKSIVGDLYFDAGIQYTLSFQEDNSFTIGAVYNHERNIQAEYESYTENLLINPLGGFYSDTVNFVSGITGTIILPRNIGAGLTFRKGDQLVVGADYYWQEWSDARFFGESDSLINSNSIHAGLEFTPDRTAIRNYLNRISYRIGGHYGNTYLKLENEQLKDFGISFGLGLPLNRMRSTVNLSFEMGKRGTTVQNLIEEKYGIIRFSLTLYDIWFMKRKFD